MFKYERPYAEWIYKAKCRLQIALPLSSVPWQSKLLSIIVKWGGVLNSLGGAERTTHLQVVVDIAGFRARVQGHVGTGTVGTLNLNVDVGKIINAESLTLGSVELSLSFLDGKCKSLSILFVTLSSGHIVQILQESVVFLVGCKLQGVLVVCEQRVVPVRQVSQSTSLKESNYCVR